MRSLCVCKSKMKLVIIFLMVLVLFSCDLSSPKEIAESEIEDLLTNLVIDFSNNDLDKIMSHYDSEYLHNGLTISNERNQWLLWLIDYNVLEIESLDIEIIDNYDAKASFKFTLSSVNSELIYLVPDEYDNISYFEIDSSDNHWKFIGNQQTE